MTADHPRSTLLEAPRRALVYVFFAASLWYLWWRAGTLNRDTPIFSGVIYAAELFGFVTSLLHIFMCWRLTDRKAPPARPGIGVDVLIPTYNESVALVRKTVLAAQAMDYPHRTWLLDDGRRPEMRRLAQELGCDYLTRSDNAHAKAGNLNHALAHSSGELVVVFDADHAPRRDFLTKTLGYFDDPAVAFVQTPQDYYNLDSYQHRQRRNESAVWTEQALFFHVIQRGKDFWNAAFFCGSCAVVRRSALERIGGFATGTVTEDLHTSIRLHACGFKSIYHAEPLAFGIAPESIEPFIGQRVRWGQGAMHVWRKEGILSHRGLSWAQRINYLASVLTYFDGWQKGVFYFAPVVVLLTGSLPLLATTPQFLLHFLPYYILTFWVFEEVGRGYGRTLFIEQYNVARFAAFAWATLAWIFPRMKFKVTAKGSVAGRALRFTAPQWSVASFNVLAIPAGIALYLHAHTLPLEGVVANIVWAAANAALALSVLAYTSVAQKRKRAHYRFPIPLPVQLDFHGSPVRGTVDDLSGHGLRFYGDLPDFVRPGSEFSGQLSLPDGPLSISGQVRNLTTMPDHPAVAIGFGGTFSTHAPGEQRLERFLFGSALQWRINGYRDQIDTPLSWLLPQQVPGPERSPFANLHWNAVQLSSPGRLPAQALASAPDLYSGTCWILSFTALPERQDLLMESSARMSSGGRVMQLSRVAVYEEGGFNLFAYRVWSDLDRTVEVESISDDQRTAA